MAGFWSTLVIIMACLLVVNATRITHKHVRHGHRAHADVAKRAAGKAQFGYFTPWGNLSAYNRSIRALRAIDVWIFAEPADIDAKSLTHILYAFAGMDGSTGVAKLTDPNSDIAILKQVGLLRVRGLAGLTHYSGFSCTNSSRSNGTSKSFSALVEALTPEQDSLPS